MLLDMLHDLAHIEQWKQVDVPDGSTPWCDRTPTPKLIASTCGPRHYTATDWFPAMCCEGFAAVMALFRVWLCAAPAKTAAGYAAALRLRPWCAVTASCQRWRHAG